MRLTDAGLSELEKLGRVATVIRIGGFHGRDDGFYRERYGAKVFALAGQHYSRKINADPLAQDYLQPDGWLDAATPLPIEGVSLFLFAGTPPEAALLVEREGGILVTGDALQNTAAPDEYANLVGRLLMRTVGAYKPYALGPGWLKAAKPTAEEVARILELSFAHVLPGHGEPVLGDAREKYRPAIEALRAS